MKEECSFENGKGRLQKKNGKENDIVHLGPDPLPPEPIMTNLNNDKLVETEPPTLL